MLTEASQLSTLLRDVIAKMQWEGGLVAVIYFEAP